MKIQIAAGTDVGLVRTNNEDNVIVCCNLHEPEWTIPQTGELVSLGEYGSLLVVADGMGGANAGEVASAIAIDTMRQLFVAENLEAVIGDDYRTRQFLKDAVTAADMAIVNRSREDVSTQGMGTTIVMAWVIGRRAYVCWCGDSRCYVFRPGQQKLLRLSHDHSYVQELVDRGELHPELAFDHPMSNIITRCLGSNDQRAVADTAVCELHHDDVLLLCSDGLCGLCTDDEIAQLMANHQDNVDICRDELISAALSAGGRDNVTVALGHIVIEGEEAAPADDDAGTAAQTDGAQDADGHDASEELKKTNPVVAPEPQKSRHGFWVVLLLIVAAAAAYWYLYMRPASHDAQPEEPQQEEVTLPATATEAEPSVQAEPSQVPVAEPEPTPEPEPSLKSEPAPEPEPAAEPESAQEAASPSVAASAEP